MRTPIVLQALVATVCAGVCAAANAQTPAPKSDQPVVRQETTRDGSSQRIERIEVEDAGNRIDELRVGGQTQSITVHPKTAVPAYDVQPPTPTRPDAQDGAGRRTWKVLNF